jgi:hypothetical protein
MTIDNKLEGDNAPRSSDVFRCRATYWCISTYKSKAIPVRSRGGP